MSKGDLYKHFKGGVYRILYRAKNTETLEDMIVYQSLETNEIWVRPAEMFFEYIETDTYKGFRFTHISQSN